MLRGLRPLRSWCKCLINSFFFPVKWKKKWSTQQDWRRLMTHLRVCSLREMHKYRTKLAAIFFGLQDVLKPVKKCHTLSSMIPMPVCHLYPLLLHFGLQTASLLMYWRCDVVNLYIVTSLLASYSFGTDVFALVPWYDIMREHSDSVLADESVGSRWQWTNFIANF